MNEEKEYIQEEREDSKPWYAKKGDDSDVFLTSRIRFARNLANFPFPNRFRGDDRQRVNAILLDVFSKVKNPDDFHLIPMENLSPQNYYILQERGILKPKHEVQNLNISQPTSIVMNSRGDISILINQIDHLRLSAFKSGLDFTTSFSLLRDLDSFFQEHVQFASSLEFGYLTCAMKDLGSGIKFSARANLKMSMNAGKLNELKKKAEESQMALLPSFPYYTNDGGLPAGIFYDIVSTKAINGSDVSQLAEMEALCSFIAEYERKNSQEYADNHMTLILNSTMRSLALARNSIFLSFKEAIGIISDVQVALRLNLISGIDYARLSSLLFRLQPGHLSYIMEEGNFDFEDDIKNDEILKPERLRALSIQEAFENISLRKL